MLAKCETYYDLYPTYFQIMSQIIFLVNPKYILCYYYTPWRCLYQNYQPLYFVKNDFIKHLIKSFFVNRLV